jgi:quercetin dioxygenase-like cupin family protein
MNHVLNSQVQARPVDSIEGTPTVGELMVKPLLTGQRMSLLEVRLPAGTASAVHAHSHESVLYVVSGRLRTTIDGQACVMGPGDVCRHADGAAHDIEALEDTVFVEIKSPVPALASVLGHRPRVAE